MQPITKIILYATALLMAAPSWSFNVASEFSAEASQQVPGRPEYHATMYVGSHAVRTESVINNKQVVEIVDQKNRTRLLLIPAEKIYVKQVAPAQQAARSTATDKSPCAGIQGVSCRQLGKETLNQRAVEKWEFTHETRGQPARSLHWIDVEHRMPLREFFPDGTLTEMVLLGKEQTDGRATEKWQMKVVHPGGQTMETLQWYDPELRIAIREEMPGGYVRELRKIKTGKQAANLFSVPGGYKEVKQLPAYLQPAQAPSAGQGMPR